MKMDIKRSGDIGRGRLVDSFIATGHNIVKIGSRSQEKVES